MSLESPSARRSNQSIPKEINPEYSLEGLMLKLQYFGHLMRRADLWKRPCCQERMRAGGEGGKRGQDGWHHRLNGQESEQAPGDSEGRGSLACCSPWGEASQRVGHDCTTARLNNDVSLAGAFFQDENKQGPKDSGKTLIVPHLTA